MTRPFAFSFCALAVFCSMSPALAQNQQTPTIPTFVEVTDAAGIDSVFEGEWEYMVGGGVAVFDCDDDGFPDIFLAGGTAPARFYRNTSAQGGNLTFSPHESGLEIEAVSGAYPIDIDGDGIMDLVLLRVGENIVMRGLGNCRFENANSQWAFDGGDAWSSAFAAIWEHGADWPTIATGNYIDRNEPMFPWGSCTDNWLHRPDETGSGFAPPLALTPSYCTLSMLFTDWDRSGTPSLRVSNDREYYRGGQEQLWRIEAGQAPRLYDENDGWQQLRIWGMGIASYDLDFNSYPDYFLTSMTDNRLQVLTEIPENGLPRPTYRDVAYARGVTAHRPYTGDEVRPSTAWHAQFEDVNNDGLADLFIAKGNVWEMPDFAIEDPNNLLLQREDGSFFEAGDHAGVASFLTARGGALADFNLNGQLDLVVVNRHDRAQIWQNTSTDLGNWLQIRLAQPGPNRNGIGAWIEVERNGVTMRREVFAGGGHVSGQAGWWHFGLGDTRSGRMRVIWPDGYEDSWQDFSPNSFYTYSRDSAAAPWLLEPLKK